MAASCGQTSIALSVATFCVLIIWIGLFTGLNVPEIQRTENYRETDCYINGSQIIRRYCPARNCPDSCATTSAASCSSISNGMQQINPDLCSLNTSIVPCPVPTTCDGGYYCCQTYCQTYKDSKGNYHTNCYCSDSTNNLACTMTPQLCYTLRLFIYYNTTSGSSVFTNYDFDTGTDGMRSVNLRGQYAVGHSYECYYDSTNLANILWNISQTAGFWAASSIFAAFTFFGCYCSFFAFIDENSGIGDASILHSINTWFWCALVLGLVLFLPLGLSPYIGHPELWYFGVAWTCFWTFVLIIYLSWSCILKDIEDCRSCCRRVEDSFQSMKQTTSRQFDQKWKEFHTWSPRFDDFVFCRRNDAPRDGPPKTPPPPPYSSYQGAPTPPLDALSGVPIPVVVVVPAPRNQFGEIEREGVCGSTNVE